MSLCTSLKGHLKSKFLVLSDDRILPPYQPNRGKRSHPDDNQDAVPGKRTHQDSTGGQTNMIPQGSTSAPLPSTSAFVPSMTIASTFAAGVHTGFGGVQPPFVPSMIMASANPTLVGVAQSAVYPPLMTQGVAPPPIQTFASAVMSVPPPQIVGSGVVSGSSGVVQAASQAPSYKIVPSRRSKGKGKNPIPPGVVKNTTSDKAASVTSGRLTPSRAAKSKNEKPPNIAEVTSPSQYESCDDSNDEAGDPIQEVKAQS